MSKRMEYTIAAVVTVLVLAWAVFAMKAPTRHQTGERFMMLAAFSSFVSTAAAIRGRARREALADNTVDATR